MCGIAGWVGGFAAAEVRERMEHALEALRFRGPDGRGLQGEKGWMLGHTRLAILDLTEHAAQPMRDAQGRWLVFNGEIYNFQELRGELEREGLAFQSSGDSEVLLQALGHWGVSVLPRLRGMFAFGWVDPARRELVLARDRYGVKPLVWERVAGGVRFASDLFALDALAGADGQRAIDGDAAWSYLLLGHVPAPAAIWQGVRKLLPGHVLTLRWQEEGEGALEIKPYWNWPATTGAGGGDSGAIHEFRERAQEALRLRLISDVPVGLLLSGGIDSSLVATLCADLPEARIPSFTMGFDDPASDERPSAARLAGHLRLRHEAFLAEETPVDALFEDLWGTYDEPFADSSALPMLLLCREIRKRVKVAISGDGGDEVWCGYPWHRALWRAEKAGVPEPLRALLRGASSLGRGSFAYKARVLGAKDRLGRWSILKTGLTDSMAEWLPLANPGAQPVQSVFAEAAARVGEVEDALDWACRMDLTTYLPDDLMVKADRASMRASLELREPLLDHEFTAWALRISAHLRFDPAAQQGKAPVRAYLQGRLPEELLRRPKQGFTPPLNAWLAGPLARVKREAIDALEGGKLEPFCLPHGVRSWEECARNLCDEHNQFLWRVLCFYGWLRRRRHGS